MEDRQKTIWEQHKDRRIQEMRDRYAERCYKGGKLKPLEELGE